MTLYVLRYWPTLSETFVANEISGLVAAGHRIEVVSLGQRADAAFAEVSNVPTWSPPRGLSLGLALSDLASVLGTRTGRQAAAWLARHQRPKDVARAAWTAVRAARSGVGRIHAHFAGEAAEVARCVGMMLDVPWSVTAHASDLACPRPSLVDLGRSARPFVVVCETWRERLWKQYQIHATVVRMGVDVDRYLPADPGRTPPTVICVARNVEKKGLETLESSVVALAIPCRLVSDRASVHPLVRTGALRHAEIPSALAQAQIFALPCRVASDGDEDAIPVVLLEAMAAGLPVVTTSVGGICEVVDQDTGWLAAPGDPNGFHTALACAAASAEQRIVRGTAGRARIVDRGLTVQSQVASLLAAWAAA